MTTPVTSDKLKPFLESLLFSKNGISFTNYRALLKWITSKIGSNLDIIAHRSFFLYLPNLNSNNQTPRIVSYKIFDGVQSYTNTGLEMNGHFQFIGCSGDKPGFVCFGFRTKENVSVIEFNLSEKQPLPKLTYYNDFTKEIQLTEAALEIAMNKIAKAIEKEIKESSERRLAS